MTITSDVAELFLHNFSYITVWQYAYHRLELSSSDTADEIVMSFINIHSYKSSQTNYLCPVPENCFCVEYQVSHFILTNCESNMAILQSSMETFKQSRWWWFKIQSRHSDMWCMIFNIHWKLWLTTENLYCQNVYVSCRTETICFVKHRQTCHVPQCLTWKSKNIFWFYEGKYWEG